jgi:hypothetical protein
MCALILVGCNLISGAEGFKVGTDDDIPLRQRRPTSTDESSDGGGARSTSSSGGSTPSDEREKDTEQDTPPPSERPDASFDATTSVPPGFSDSFERPDGPTIGNEWFEKKDAFRISNGAVVQDGIGIYYNWFVRRPYTEAARDVQVELDFTFGSHERTDPTIFARIQPGSDERDILTCYTFYAYPDFAGIDREDGDKRTGLADSDLTQLLVAGQTYHFVFRVRGVDPVELDGAITTTSGKVVGTVSAVDHSAKRITAAGPIGFGSGKGDGSRWDNVVRTDL